jgi:hypothetical protein
MSDTIQSAEALAYKLRETKPDEGIIIWPENVLSLDDAAKLIESRDAEIRADEARKQAERYAACVDLAEEVKRWAEAYPKDIFHEPTSEQCREAFEKAGFNMTCFSAMVLRLFTKPWGEKASKALAELEATECP